MGFLQLIHNGDSPKVLECMGMAEVLLMLMLM